MAPWWVRAWDWPCTPLRWLWPDHSSASWPAKSSCSTWARSRTCALAWFPRSPSTRCPTSVPTGQHEHRDLPGGLGLVFGDGRRLRDQPRPQLGASGVVEFFRYYRERLGAHLDCDGGIGLEVVIPARVGWRSSVGGDDRHAAVRLGVAGQRRDAHGARLGADMVDENHRGAGQWPADPSLVRPELVNDL